MKVWAGDGALTRVPWPRVRGLALLVLLLSGTAGAQAVSKASPERPKLSVPAGRSAIGRRAFALVDRSRRDASAGEADGRELMVYVWYPARRGSQGVREDYLPGARAMEHEAQAKAAMVDEVGAAAPAIVSGALKSHAVAGARPARRSGGFPVVLFSHGASATTFSYTAQIEDLVSHGYAVVAIEHTGMAGVVWFSSGRVVFYREPAPTKAGDAMAAAIAAAKAATETGAEDDRFVLEELRAGRIGLARYMDLSRVAAVGHSAGGTLSVRACQIDVRLRACVSEEGDVNPVGAFFDYADRAKITQPVLLIGRESAPTDEMLGRLGETRAQWTEYQAHRRRQMETCGAGSRHVVLGGKGVSHASFSDGPVLNAAAGSNEAKVALGNLRVTEDLVRAFLDAALKGQGAGGLQQMVAREPGVSMEAIGMAAMSEKKEVGGALPAARAGGGG